MKRTATLLLMLPLALLASCGGGESDEDQIAAVVEQLKNNYQPISELKTAVIWTKGVSTFQPDYSVDFLPTNPWINQPFEPYDNMRPEKLMEKWKI